MYSMRLQYQATERFPTDDQSPRNLVYCRIIRYVDAKCPCKLAFDSRRPFKAAFASRLFVSAFASRAFIAAFASRPFLAAFDSRPFLSGFALRPFIVDFASRPLFQPLLRGLL